MRVSTAVLMDEFVTGVGVTCVGMMAFDDLTGFEVSSFHLRAVVNGIRYSRLT